VHAALAYYPRQRRGDRRVLCDEDAAH
jgi:hypothetical protein